MSKIKYFFGFILALAISGCTDWVDPAIPYSEFETGAYLRTLQYPSTNFIFSNLPTSEFKIIVEAVDIEDGKLVREVDVLVARRRGQTVSPEVKIGTLTASDFQPHSIILPDVHPTSGSKYPAATFQIGIPAVLNALGLSLTDITGGDFFEFRLVLHTTDGRTFSNNNLSPDISGGQYYRSPFFYRIPVVCTSNLAGTYDLSTTGWCGGTYTGKVRFVATPDNGVYNIEVNLLGADEFVQDFSFGVYRSCYGPNTAPPGGASGLRLLDVCGRLSYNTSPSSPWGDLWMVDAVTVNGPVLTLEVSSNFPPEAGTAVITRTDGSNWPPLRK
jgi:hypothetical protein